MLIHTQVLWAQRTLATHVDGLAGGGGALRALERKLARCCEADGEVPLPARATRADSTRAAEVAALYGLRAEEYADGAVRYLSCRRLPGARPPQPLLSEHAATAPPPRFLNSMASFSASVAARRRSVASGLLLRTASSQTSRN